MHLKKLNLVLWSLQVERALVQQSESLDSAYDSFWKDLNKLKWDTYLSWPHFHA